MGLLKGVKDNLINSTVWSKTRNEINCGGPFGALFARSPLVFELWCPKLRYATATKAQQHSLLEYFNPAKRLKLRLKS